MRINHNIAALNTHRQLSANTSGSSKNLEKLSSGLRINRAGDDAAGLAISEKNACANPRAGSGGTERPGRNFTDSNGGGCVERGAIHSAAYARTVQPGGE